MKVVAIVQARMGSTRLPGKVLQPLAGKPAILRMLERVAKSQTITELWLATSDLPRDDELAVVVEAAEYRVFRGSEDDVLERYYKLAAQAKADVVVRLTGDCPLHDSSVIDTVIRAFIAQSVCSYAANVFPPSYPDGLDVEVFNFAALEHAHLTCHDPREREHVTPGIHRQHHPEPKPEIINVAAPTNFSHLRWTLDTPEDLEFIREVYDRLNDQPDFSWMDVLALLTRDPSLLEINSQYQRDWRFKDELARKPLG
jgi:spore coat polysaccharide biosynthesis protein SpsF (cytidylyltransferase family)